MTKKERIAALEKQVADLMAEVSSLQAQMVQLLLKPYTAPQPLPKVTPEWDIQPTWWRPNTSDATRPYWWDKVTCVSGDPRETLIVGRSQ